MYKLDGPKMQSSGTVPQIAKIKRPLRKRLLIIGGLALAAWAVPAMLVFLFLHAS